MLIIVDSKHIHKLLCTFVLLAKIRLQPGNRSFYHHIWRNCIIDFSTQIFILSHKIKQSLRVCGTSPARCVNNGKMIVAFQVYAIWDIVKHFTNEDLRHAIINFTAYMADWM